MYERMNHEAGMPLGNRFVMYIDFLVQLVRLLSRCGKKYYTPDWAILTRRQQIAVVRSNIAGAVAHAHSSSQIFARHPRYALPTKALSRRAIN